MLGERKAAICLWLSGSGCLKDSCNLTGVGEFIPEVGEESRKRKATLRMYTFWRALREVFFFFFFFPDALYPNVTLAMASDTQSL